MRRLLLVAAVCGMLVGLIRPGSATDETWDVSAAQPSRDFSGAVIAPTAPRCVAVAGPGEFCDIKTINILDSGTLAISVESDTLADFTLAAYRDGQEIARGEELSLQVESGEWYDVFVIPELAAPMTTYNGHLTLTPSEPVSES